MSFSRDFRALRTLPAAIVVATFFTTAAHAADRSFGKGKGSGPLLTRAELRECMATQQRLHTKRDETVQLQAELDKQKQDIVRRGDELKEQLVWLDRTSQEQVDKYNGQAVERDKMIDDYQARATGFNAQVDALKADTETFSKKCENRRYDEKDEIAIKNGK